MTAPERPLRILAHDPWSPRIRREIDRRHFLGLIAAAGGAGLLAACGGAGGSKPSVTGTPSQVATGGPIEGALNMYSWGDYDDPSV